MPRVPDAPVARPDSYSGYEDGTLYGTAQNGVLKNDQEFDANTMHAELVTGAAHGHLDLKNDGTFVYQPDKDFNGVDTFTYRAVENAGTLNAVKSQPVTVTLTVLLVADAPVAVANSYAASEDAPLVVGAAAGVLANDRDADGDPLTGSLVGGPADGALTLNADGSFRYVPKADWSGTDSFTYRASDGTLNSQPVTVTVTVAPANDAPDAVNDGTYQTAWQTALVQNAATLLAKDSDIESDALSIVRCRGR